jgi:hypothetical protein
MGSGLAEQTNARLRWQHSSRWIALAALLVVGWISQSTALAAVKTYSSLYAPTLTVTLDGVAADRSVVVRAHHNSLGEDRLFLCSRGLCDYQAPTEPWAWSYTVEQFNSKAPSEALSDKVTLNAWHTEHAEQLTISYDVTTVLRQTLFQKTPRKRDHTLQLTSQDHTVELVTVDAGEYDPLPQSFSLSNLTFELGGIKKQAVGFGTIALTIVIIYFGIKIVTI